MGSFLQRIEKRGGQRHDRSAALGGVVLSVQLHAVNQYAREHGFQITVGVYGNACFIAFFVRV